MGCSCSRHVDDNDIDAYKRIKKRKGSQKFLKKIASLSQSKKSHVEKEVGINDEIKSEWDVDDEGKKVIFIDRALSVRGGVDGAHVAAGWPLWLTAVAGEAINGWLPRKMETFQKLDKIGQGTYSNVFRARDLVTGKMVALKKVKFSVMDPDSVRFMAREIVILRRLDHPNVMQLEGVITSRVSSELYLVFEYMDHDLAGLAASPMVRFTEPQIKCYMQQLLRGLEHCHSRGVLHRDIKGANLLIDNNGVVKIADFGLATFSSSPDHKEPLTNRVVTLWYRPPELLLGSTDYGIEVDLWSCGCILAELFAGKPLMPGRTEVEQLHKIFKLCGSPSDEYWKMSKLPLATIFRPQHPYRRRLSEVLDDVLPPSALELLERLLAFEPNRRGTPTSALQSKFFQTEPLPCDPSSLPKYPPSKQYDAKLRHEEAIRKKSMQSSNGHNSMQIISASQNMNERLNLSSLNRPHKPWETATNTTSQTDRKQVVNQPNSSHHFLGIRNNIQQGIALSTERMVEEHQKQIQNPITKARVEKKRIRKCVSEDGLTTTFLECITEE